MSAGRGALLAKESADLSEMAARSQRRRDRGDGRRRREHGRSSPASTTGGASPSSARSRATPRCPQPSPRCCAATTVYLYEDSVLVKEPGAVERTQWHQDLGVLPRRRRPSCARRGARSIPPTRTRARCGSPAGSHRPAGDLPAEPVRDDRADPRHRGRARARRRCRAATTTSSRSHSNPATSPCTTPARCTRRGRTGRPTTPPARDLGALLRRRRPRAASAPARPLKPYQHGVTDGAVLDSPDCPVVWRST